MKRRSVTFLIQWAPEWHTYSEMLQRILREREDLDADMHFLDVQAAPCLYRTATRRGPSLFGNKHLLHPMFAGDACGRQWLRRHGGPEGVDIVHIAPHFLAPPFIEHLPPSISLSVTVDSTLRRPVRETPALLGNSVALAMETAVFRRADRLYCRTDWAARSLIRDYDIAEERISILPPSVIMDARRPATQHRDSFVHIGLLGDASKDPGAIDLLTVHQKYFARRSRLHVVSPQPLRRPMINVIEYPHLNGTEISNGLLPTLDIFCAPSRQEEALSSVVEASAAGVPSVAIRCGGMGELCIHGETGLLYEPGDRQGLADALGRMIADRDMRARFGAAALSMAREKFCARRNYNLLLDTMVANSHNETPPQPGLSPPSLVGLRGNLPNIGLRLGSPAKVPPRKEGRGPTIHCGGWAMALPV